jgi:plastocyanin
MKSKLIIFIIIILIIGGIYFAVKKSPVQAPTIQEQTQTQSSSSEMTASGMEGVTEEEMMNRGGGGAGGVMNQEKTAVGAKTSQHIVNYTDKGFSPASLEIKVGETVQFVNQSGGGMWTASGPHPSHAAYPEFDAKKNIPSGGTYEFTFAKIGEWKYHNHTKAGMYGTIIVK